jgi:hypothetical protein
MANSNFVVHNGLTVGPLTIDAATGSITTTGNLSVAGFTANITQDTIQANAVATGTLTIQQVGGLVINGAVGATVADATALAIALGG